MDSEALLAYLAIEFDALLAEANIAPTDTPDGLGPVLDAVAMIADAQPDLDTAWHRLLARYYTLDRILNRFAVNMNVSISGDSYSLQQQFANVKALRDDARNTVAWLLDPVMPGTSADGGGIVTIEMPFLTGGDAPWP